MQYFLYPVLYLTKWTQLVNTPYCFSWCTPKIPNISFLPFLSQVNPSCFSPKPPPSSPSSPFGAAPKHHTTPNPPPHHHVHHCDLQASMPHHPHIVLDWVIYNTSMNVLWITQFRIMVIRIWSLFLFHDDHALRHRVSPFHWLHHNSAISGGSGVKHYQRNTIVHSGLLF